ncbi:hypothetical protein EZ428_03320 [Pedobacter frigiditerrae]|uniref:MetA-pathway of phenol degradation n=1 Tax=Pedobacter frigiditerrae TaxID=2530452 RepID=A0A4R0N292_9SPHI|nr:hypothetical protein [Pedobacter frigiditerrae]TCC93815.1 hypothetical protein EZ428_03320 [Pedobacter frigiditerrae]
MIRKLIGLLLVFIGFNQSAFAQELYVFTEPASNMPKNSIAIRLTNEGMFKPSFTNRTIVEGMVGLNKSLMFHLQGFMSDMDGKYRVEGGSFYAKYRFLSMDNDHSHFRGALYGRVSTSKRDMVSEDINLEGDNSGWQGGLVFTQLIHKLALSATLGYSSTFKKQEDMLYFDPGMMFHSPTPMFMAMKMPNEMFNYSLSSGYLLLPFVYKNYNQPNFNLYFEVLGKTNPANGNSYLDLAPAIQVILNSKTRIDVGYRFQATGNMPNRYLKNMYLARIEFNFFNALSKK